jgi:methionyl-tRNA synthetase
MNVLIGGAWPYANGPLHIGHIAALLPGDVLARYHRAKGDDVFYVSGSDCFGTPVSIRAKQENKTPQEISDYYHKCVLRCVFRTGLQLRLYGKTTSEAHQSFVKAFHKRMYEGGYIYEKTGPEAYCGHCLAYRTDRYVLGVCPECGAEARGDQCDACGAVNEPGALIGPRCSVCGNDLIFKDSRHLYLAVSNLQKELTGYINKPPRVGEKTRSLFRKGISAKGFATGL